MNTVLLWHLFVGSRGGQTRTRILIALCKHPRNTHQLSTELNLDYKTVQHHIRLLEKNMCIFSPVKDSYGATYGPSEEFVVHKKLFEEIVASYGLNLGKPSKAKK